MKRKGLTGALPVVLQLIAVEFRPVDNQLPSTPGQFSVGDFGRRDVDLRLELSVSASNSP